LDHEHIQDSPAIAAAIEIKKSSGFSEFDCKMAYCRNSVHSVMAVLDQISGWLLVSRNERVPGHD